MIGLVVALAATAEVAPKSDLQTVIDEMTLPGVEVSLAVIPCGQENAAYVPSARTIVVCREILILPQPVLRTIVAHEMAHAIIHQLDLPVPGSEEAAADELAAVSLLLAGDEDAVLAAAVWMEGRPGDEDVWDDHQSGHKRAATLMCLAVGSEDRPVLPECRSKFMHAYRTWGRLLLLAPPVAA